MHLRWSNITEPIQWADPIKRLRDSWNSIFFYILFSIFSWLVSTIRQITRWHSTDCFGTIFECYIHKISVRRRHWVSNPIKSLIVKHGFCLGCASYVEDSNANAAQRNRMFLSVMSSTWGEEMVSLVVSSKRHAERPTVQIRKQNMISWSWIASWMNVSRPNASIVSIESKICELQFTWISHIVLCRAALWTWNPILFFRHHSQC